MGCSLRRVRLGPRRAVSAGTVRLYRSKDYIIFIMIAIPYAISYDTMVIHVEHIIIV